MFTSELAWIKSMSAVDSVGGGGRKAGTEPLNGGSGGGRKAGIAPLNGGSGKKAGTASLNGGSGGTSGGSGTVEE